MDFNTLLTQARPAERTVALCLRGDLVAAFEELDRQRAAAQEKGASSLAGNGAAALARQMEDLREQMREFTVTFRLRALSRKAYQALLAEHPPRRGADGNVLADDATFDVDTSTFWFPLVKAALVEPQLSDEQYERLIDEVLSDRQFEQLAAAALAASRGDVDIPFSFAASALLSDSGGESRQLSGSGSASNGSTGGSLATPSSEMPAGG